MLIRSEICKIDGELGLPVGTGTDVSYRASGEALERAKRPNN